MFSRYLLQREGAKMQYFPSFEERGPGLRGFPI